ncbi:MAG TPA: hypothetical protein VGL07_05030 [Buttiauxella sp.]
MGSSLLLSPSSTHNGNSPEWGEISQTFTVHADVDTAATRLKRYFRFKSDDKITAEKNSGRGNSGWVASVMAEGTGWNSQTESYYRVSRIWGKTDHITRGVSHEGNSCHVTATYRLEDPSHLKAAWTEKLWAQISPMAEGKIR